MEVTFYFQFWNRYDTFGRELHFRPISGGLNFHRHFGYFSVIEYYYYVVSRQGASIYIELHRRPPRASFHGILTLPLMV